MNKVFALIKKAIKKGLYAPIISRYLGKLADLCLLSKYVQQFVYSDVGFSYGLSVSDKVAIVNKFKNNVLNIPSGTPYIFHIIMANEILQIPKDKEGDIIECGCWKGASTANLSIIADIVGRKLWVCDSFEGLPHDENLLHLSIHSQAKGKYHKGDWVGSIEEVKQNIEKFGVTESCKFVKGYYKTSLKTISNNKYVFAFLDVDLVSSTKECLIHIWPLLEDDCKIYSDDASDLAIAKIFFNDVFWSENFRTNAPGFVGSGCGLPVRFCGSPHGYCWKKPSIERFTVPNHLHK